MLDELKNYLNITWDDTATDIKVGGILTRAETILNNYSGYEIDFDADNSAKQLLFDCCRYIWNNAYEDFVKNFQSDLVALRARYKAENYEDDAE